MELDPTIAALQRGDINALDILIGRYQTKAVRVAYLITGDTALAEDVMQSAFVRVYDRISQFDPQRPFEPWFMRIVVNMALKVVGRSAVHLPMDFSAADLLPDPYPGPETAAEMAETEQVVRAALDKLTPEQRAVIVLRYYLDYSEQEISAETSSPIGTVRWRLHAARKRLRGLLAHLGRQEPGVERGSL